MKKILTLVILICAYHANAQNVGIGNTNPHTKLEVTGAISSTPVSAPAANAVVIPDNVSIFRLTLVAGVQFNALSMVNPQEGQYLTIYNEDDSAAYFAGFSIAASGGIKSLEYINAAWHVVSDNQTAVATAPVNIYNSNGTLTGTRTVTMGANNLNLSSAGGNVTLSGGNVGIGTTTPANPLEVHTDAATITAIDQSQTYVNDSAFLQNYSKQTFTPALSGNLQSITIFLLDTPTSNMVMWLSTGNTLINTSGLVPGPNTFFATGAIPLVAGGQYSFGIFSPQIIVLASTHDDVYSGGHYLFNGFSYGGDLYFQTTMTYFNPTQSFTVSPSGKVGSSTLAGSGDRLVTADALGNLSARQLPQNANSFGDNIYNTNGVLNGPRWVDLSNNSLVLANGKIGIGYNPEPKSLLHLQSSNADDVPIGDILMVRYWGNDANTRASSIFHYNNSSATGGVGSDNLAFGVSGNGGSNDRPNSLSQIKMVIQANGNVGIGATNPGSKLEVAGNISATNLQMTSGAAVGYVLQSDSNGNGSWVAPSSSGLNIYNADGVLSSTRTIWMNGNNLVLHSGYLGIGNGNPDYPLHIGVGPGLRVEGWDVPGTSYTTASFGAYGDISVDAANLPGGRFIVKENGNVGIGAANPSNALEVNGNTKTANLQMTNGAAAGYFLKSDANGNASWVPYLVPIIDSLSNHVNTITCIVNGVAATAPIVNTVGNTSSANTLKTTVNGVAGATVPIVNSVSNTISGNTLSTTVNGVTGTAVTLPIAATTNTFSNPVNTITSTVNGVAATATAVNTVSNTISGNTLSTTVNGVTATAVTLPVAATTNTFSNPVNTITSTVNGVTATGPAVNTVSNTSSANNIFTTVNGVQGSTVPIINSNALSLSVSSLTSTVNGVASSPLSLAALSLAGDATGTLAAATVNKINGTSMAGLGTGILKNTTGTGVPSIAGAADFPTLNQNTTGSAGSFTGSLTGDVTGSQGATALSKIQGAPISVSSLASGNILQYNGSAWVNVASSAIATQNFVDLTTTQTAAGVKSWSSNANFRGIVTMNGTTQNTNQGIEWNYANNDRYGLVQSTSGGTTLYTSSLFGGSFISFALSGTAGGALGSELMRITHAGQVGIGQPVPNAMLDVNGNVQISNSGIPMGLMTELPGTTTPLLNFDVNFRESNKNTAYIGAAFRIDTRGGTNNLFQWLYRSPGNIESIPMVLSATGNLGINNINPAYALDVNGTANITGAANIGAWASQSIGTSGSNGYAKVGSIIIQWGTGSYADNNAVSVNFPIAFSNVFSVTATNNDRGGGSGANVPVKILTTSISSFSYGGTQSFSGDASSKVTWMAIGN